MVSKSTSVHTEAPDCPACRAEQEHLGIERRVLVFQTDPALGIPPLLEITVTGPAAAVSRYGDKIKVVLESAE